jgi:CheY-like chemotaxis protein
MSKQRVLIVEDETPLREAFAFLLTKEGFAVEQAENGKVALTKLKAFEPNLLLLDMLMPVMNGEEFLQHADLATAYPELKTIMLSNLSDAISIEDASVYGVTDSVLKADLSPVQLAAMVKKLLNADQ